jgi:hypothetical protein
MKIRALMCVLVLIIPAAGQTPAFEKAPRYGEGKQQSFFLFTASTGKYAVRNDGLGEIRTSKTRAFYLTVGGSGRIEQVYFHEYQGDLLLLYEVSNGQGGIGYLTRLNPQTRKNRWTTPIDVNNIGSCKVEAEEAHCGELNEVTRINLKTGAEIKTTS